MPRPMVFRMVSIACLILVATIGATLGRRFCWEPLHGSAIAAADYAQRQEALADSLTSLPSGTGADSLIPREAESGPVHLDGPTLVVWDDPGQGGDPRPAILLQPPVVNALRKVAEEEGFTLAIRTTRGLRIDSATWYYGASRGPGSRSESLVLVAPGAQSEQYSGLMSPEEVRAWLRHYRNTYRS